MERKNIFLTGFMGTGKSTVAGELCRKHGFKQMEMDACIAERQGMTINEIFSRYGEAYFRDLETELLVSLQKQEGMVVSCGGGAVMRRENVEVMKKSGSIILLTALPGTVYERVKNSKDRPILNDNMSVEFITGLMEKRREAYEAAADLIVKTDGKTAGSICGEIIRKLEIQDKGNK